MNAQRPVSVSIRNRRARLIVWSALGGFLWGTALSILGLWVLANGASYTLFETLGPIGRASLGVLLLGAGQLVFLMMTADRLFPASPRVLTRRVQLALIGLCSVSVVLTFGVLTLGSSS